MVCLSARSSGGDNLASQAQLGLPAIPLAGPPLDRSAAGSTAGQGPIIMIQTSRSHLAKKLPQ